MNLGFLSLKDGLYYRRDRAANILRNVKVDRNMSFQSLYEGSINSLAIESVENKYVICGTSSGIIAVYDVSSFHGKQEYAPVAHIGKSNAFCPGNVKTVSWYPMHTGFFASSGEGGILTIWDTNLLRPLDKYRISSVIHNHAFGLLSSSASLIAVACEQSQVRIVDYRIGSSSHVLDTHDSSVICVSWSPSDERLLCSGGKNGRVLFWDIRSCKFPLTSLSKYQETTYPHAAMKSQSNLPRAHSGPVIGLHFANDNTSLLSLGRDSLLRLWDTRTATWICDFSGVSNNMMQYVHHVGVTSVMNSSPPVALVPDGKAVRIVSLSTGDTLSRLNGHFDQVTSVVVVPDGTCRIVTGGYDQSILMWSFQPNPMPISDEEAD